MRRRRRSRQAAWDTVPPVAPLFWSLPRHGRPRLLISSRCSRRCSRRQHAPIGTVAPGCSGSVAFSLPLPWIAAELGWYVAEVGRQPWTIDGVLPTFLSVPRVPAANVCDLARACFVVVLFGAAGGGDVPDGAHHPEWARIDASRASYATPAPGPPRARSRPNKETKP